MTLTAGLMEWLSGGYKSGSHHCLLLICSCVLRAAASAALSMLLGRDIMGLEHAERIKVGFIFSQSELS